MGARGKCSAAASPGASPRGDPPASASHGRRGFSSWQVGLTFLGDGRKGTLVSSNAADLNREAERLRAHPRRSSLPRLRSPASESQTRPLVSRATAPLAQAPPPARREDRKQLAAPAPGPPRERGSSFRPEVSADAPRPSLGPRSVRPGDGGGGRAAPPGAPRPFLRAPLFRPSAPHHAPSASPLAAPHLPAAPRRSAHPPGGGEGGCPGSVGRQPSWSRAPPSLNVTPHRAPNPWPTLPPPLAPPRLPPPSWGSRLRPPDHAAPGGWPGCGRQPRPLARGRGP